MNEQDRKALAEWGKHGCKILTRFKQYVERIFGGQQMTEQRTITLERYNELRAKLTIRFDEVKPCCQDEAKAALDEQLEALGIEVEAHVPIQDQRWIPVDAEGGGYTIFSYESLDPEYPNENPRFVGTVAGREDKDFILGAQQLVNVVIEHIKYPINSGRLREALNNMNVEVTE